MVKIKNSELYFLISSLAAGGAERQVSYLQKEFPESIILCLEEKETHYNIDPKRVIYINKSENFSKIKKTLLLPISVFKIYRILKTSTSDTTLVGFMEYSNIICYIISFVLPIKIVLSVRNTISKHYLSKSFILGIIHKLAIFIYKRAPLIVTNSYGSKEDLMQFGVKKDKIHVIHNMYDVKNILDKSNEILPNEIEKVLSFPNVLCVGRFEKQKGLEYLIEVFSIIKKELNEIKLILVGEGSLKRHLVDLCQILNLNVCDSERDVIGTNFDVYFMGKSNNPYIYYQKCTIFALPSLYEGFPNVLVEAGICGATCVASNCLSGPSELFLDRVISNINKPFYTPNGVLLPVFGNIADSNIYDVWTETLTSLLLSEELRLSMANNLKYKSQKYSIDIISQEWNNVISS